MTDSSQSIPDIAFHNDLITLLWRCNHYQGTLQNNLIVFDNIADTAIFKQNIQHFLYGTFTMDVTDLCIAQIGRLVEERIFTVLLNNLIACLMLIAFPCTAICPCTAKTDIGYRSINIITPVRKRLLQTLKHSLMSFIF